MAKRVRTESVRLERAFPGVPGNYAVDEVFRFFPHLSNFALLSIPVVQLVVWPILVR